MQPAMTIDSVQKAVGLVRTELLFKAHKHELQEKIYNIYTVDNLICADFSQAILLDF